MRFFDDMCDETIIKAYQEGEELSIVHLFEKHKALIYALANRLCCPYGMTEELVQSGCIGLIRAAQDYDASRNVRFITYAVPWILGEMRKTMRLLLSGCREYSLDAIKGEEYHCALDTFAFCDGIDIDLLDLRLAVRQLDGDERLLILLRYFREKTQKETAILLQKSQAQVSRMERRILSRLKESLS